MKLLPILTSILGLAIGLAIGIFFRPTSSESVSREETTLAFYNRETAIETGDREMQRYFEEVITWNAVLKRLPVSHFDSHRHKITWLDDTPPPGKYRRIKDGTSYPELLALAKERQSFGKLPARPAPAKPPGPESP